MQTTFTPPTGSLATSRPIDTTAPTTAQPLVVATDGTESADAAFIAARLLAQHCGAPVTVLTVLEQQLVYFPAPYPIIPVEAERAQLDALTERVRRQLDKQVGATTGWTVETRYGLPASTITRAARESRAEMILTGLSKHGVLDRVFGEETSPHIAQVTDVPLLTVAPNMDHLPRVIVVAVDPHSPAVPDSAAMRALLSEVEAVHLVNVQPRSTDTLGFAPAPWDQTYEEGLNAALDRVKQSLGLPAKVFQNVIVALGNPAREILRTATEVKADMLIVAQRRRGVLLARPGGGLAARLLRGTTCSVLVLPQPVGEPRVIAPITAMHTQTLSDRTLWSARLGEISRRNVGRRVSLEIDDTRLGAQAQATDYPFLGADYDRTDDRVTIMLGNPKGGTSHLTHTITAPVSIDLLEGNDGHARVLRVEDEGGQALVTFLG